MSCNLTSTWSVPCRDAAGGLKYLYLTTDEIEGITLNADGEVEGISGATTANLYYIGQLKGTSGFVETINADAATASLHYTQDITLQFTRNSTEARDMVKTLAQAPNMSAIVVDNNDQSHLIENITLVSGNGGSGTAFTDLNGFSVVLQGVSFGEPASTLIDGGVKAAGFTLTGFTINDPA